MIDPSDLVLLIDAVIGFTLLECIGLLMYHRRTGAGVAPRDFLAGMLAGLCLMAALRLSANALSSPWLLVGLLAAGIAHGADIVMRWRRPASSLPLIAKGLA